MSDKGYIKLDRAIENWRYKTKPNYVALWVHILVKANHEDRQVYETLVERGCLLTSLDRLARETGLSVQNVRTILNHLNGEELTIKSTNKNTLIYVNKYNDYQGANKQTNKLSNKQLTNNQQTTNNKQYIKETKSIKEIYINAHSEEFVKVFEAYLDHRKKLKKPLNDYGMRLILKDLEKKGDEKTQIAVLEQSISKGWVGIFDLKEPVREKKEEELW